MAINFEGVIPPVVLARHDDGSLDLTSYCRNLERLIAAGVHGLFVLGSSGEGAFCTFEEREDILAATVETVAGRTPVMVGCIDMQTTRVIEMVQQAQRYGADAVVATAPFLSLIHISEPTRPVCSSRMPSSA